MDQPKGPSWKNPAAGKPLNASRKSWQPSAKPKVPKASDPRTRFRNRLLGAGITGSLLIALVVVVIWLWRPPKQPALILVAPDSTAALSAPPNVYSANGSKEFAAWAAQSKEHPHIIDADWKTALSKVNQKSVILCFSGQGAVDRDGPYLFRDGAKGERLPVKEILQRLAEVPAEKQKLLIFDGRKQRPTGRRVSCTTILHAV